MPEAPVDRSFLRVLGGEAISPPPIWFMRQAGRYLPEYRALRAEAGSFLDLCYNPDFATEVTLQPIRRFDLDAAILFADILLIPHALGQKLWFEPGEGPKLEPTFSPDMLDAFAAADIDQTLAPIHETVSQVRAALPKEKALIGFAGAPWTVATYMLAGGSTKDPSALRTAAYEDPAAFDALIGQLVDATAHYLIRQAEAGADALQIFDSWATGLPEAFFDRYCVAPVIDIAKRVHEAVGPIPIIGFPRGAGPAYPKVAQSDEIAAVSIDTGMPWAFARETLSPHGAVQGGLDPLLVVQGGQPMLDAASALLETFDGAPFIFNLGHGFTPQTPPENVAALVEHIRAR